MQYVSRHSSAARRSQARPLLQPPVDSFSPRYASAVAGLPSLGGGDFALPATYRLTRPVATVPTMAAPAPRRAAESSGMERVLLGLGMGSTAGLTLGAWLCSAIFG